MRALDRLERDAEHEQAAHDDDGGAGRRPDETAVRGRFTAFEQPAIRADEMRSGLRSLR